ncbi:MAG TPA: cyclodeaminase/cyclohydrolase family protein [Candidatus Limnocylindrales bacterium]|nr:cyclodeaminase/cyclohydrolase family protein [Candidatus Limnocylindrales bacterium]
MDTSNRFRDLTVAQFVDALASGEPVPGGGAAAAIAGSLGAALVAMVANLSAGRPKYEAHAALLDRSIPAAQELYDRMLALADEDAEAFSGYGAAMKLPRETDDDKAARSAAIREAALAATLSPLKTVEATLEIVAMAEALAGRSNKNASSDLEVAALMSVAACRAAAANVYINLPSLGDESRARQLYERTEAIADTVERLAAQTREVVRSGRARDPLPGTRA